MRYRIASSSTRDGLWSRLARLWRCSIEQNAPDAETHWSDLGHRRLGHLPANYAKLNVWVEQCEQAARDGVPLVLMDTDTAVFGDLWPAFRSLMANGRPVGYTVRQNHIGFNSGVLYLLPCPESVETLRRMIDACDDIMSSGERKRDAVQRASGCNQAAWQDILPWARDRCQSLPCGVWNCCDDEWRTFDPERTRVLHIKGKLRGHVLAGPRRGGRYPRDIDRAVRACHGVRGWLHDNAIDAETKA